jgi:dimeric dUTPase (all-alpha-NTP-PPase superfamily)
MAIDDMRPNRVGIWQLDKTINGKRVRFSTGVKDKHLALRVAMARLTNKKRSKYYRHKAPASLAEVEDWESYARALPRDHSAWLYRLWRIEARRVCFSYEDLVETLLVQAAVARLQASLSRLSQCRAA